MVSGMSSELTTPNAESEVTEEGEITVAGRTLAPQAPLFQSTTTSKRPKTLLHRPNFPMEMLLPTEDSLMAEMDLHEDTLDQPAATKVLDAITPSVELPTTATASSLAPTSPSDSPLHQYLLNTELWLFQLLTHHFLSILFRRGFACVRKVNSRSERFRNAISNCTKRFVFGDAR